MRFSAVLALSAAFVYAQTPPLPKGVQRGASVEGITEYRLDNGLRVVLFPDPSKPTTTVNITYLVGSRHENYGETGMAHILEHLMSYGSGKHPDAKAEQTARGARRNASTWYDRTNYFEIFPASDENLEWALDLEADRMVNAFVKKEILDSQMSVVRNEMEAGEDVPARVLSARMDAAAYLWHNYGKSTIGARSDVEKVPIERLQAFYRRYYRPDNAVLIIAGKFDEAKAVKLLAEKFAGVARPAEPVPEPYTVEPTQDGDRTIVVRRAGDVQLVSASYHVPAAAHPDSAAISVIEQVMTTPPSGRLYKALVESKKAATAGSEFVPRRDPGDIGFTATVRKESSLEEAKHALLGTLEGIAATPITTDEVERARARLLRDIELHLTNSEQVAMALTEWVAAGDWRLLFLHRDRIRKITPEEVQRAAVSYLIPSNRTLGMFIPDDKPVRAAMPAAPDIAALVRDYKGDAAVATGEVFDPSTGNVEKRTTRAKLANGMKLTLLPKKTRGQTVAGVIQLNYGSAQSLAGRATASNAVRGMLMRGTAKHSRQQIQDELTRLKAQMNVTGSAPVTELQFQTTRANLPEVLKLAEEILREPAFPEAEWEQYKQAALAAAEQNRTNPNAMASIALARHLNPYPSNDPRYIPGFEEQIELLGKATLTDAKKFYADFYGASSAQLALVGDFDTAQVQKLTADLFGNWKSPQPWQHLERRHQKIASANQSLEAPDKANAMFMAGLIMPVSDEHPDYPALVVANYILGGTSTSRLYERIRAKEGLSYGVGSQFNAGTRDQLANWMVFAISAPQNSPKVEAAFRDELSKTLKDGFPAEEIEKAKKSWLQAQNVRRSDDTALARRLVQLGYDDRTMTWEGELEQKVAALTAEQVSAAARRHLDPAQVSIFKAGDFRKVDAAQ
ncbi:MAG TPA: pitrilysin family protein [Bryobacteraceae bacterium]|nr:pitrilysin family protein [Bryobacteraceae bacterium]